LASGDRVADLRAEAVDDRDGAFHDIGSRPSLPARFTPGPSGPALPSARTLLQRVLIDLGF
jgi:hypothetical protein